MQKNIDSIVVVRTGVIRQAKPYYLRTRSQKGQRIKERFTKAAKKLGVLISFFADYSFIGHIDVSTWYINHRYLFDVLGAFYRSDSSFWVLETIPAHGQLRCWQPSTMACYSLQNLNF